MLLKFHAKIDKMTVSKISSLIMPKEYFFSIVSINILTGSFYIVFSVQCPTFDTSDLGISGVSLGTETDGLVVGHEALGVGAAVARVGAVAVEAGLGLGAVIIGGAAQHGHS